MKAWVLQDINKIEYKDVEMPIISEREVLVKVKAVGICGSDIPRIYKDGAHIMPLIPGHEFSGKVIKVGKCVEKNWNNKRVGVFPLIPCYKCKQCKQKQYQLCENYDYLGSRSNGGFAEYVAVPEWNLIEIPKDVLYEEAAMIEPMAVALHAINRVKFDKIDNIVIYGLGTIGMLILMFLLEQGCENIFVIGNKKFQEENIKKLGIPEHNYCDSKTCNISKWIDTHINGGVNTIFECVGKNETYSQSINIVSPNGNICLVGNPYSNMNLDKETYWKILRKQVNIIGTWNSLFTKEVNDEWHKVLKLLENKRINPLQFISHRLPLEQLDIGLKIMKEKSEDYLKIMLLTDK